LLSLRRGQPVWLLSCICWIVLQFHLLVATPVLYVLERNHQSLFRSKWFNLCWLKRLTIIWLTYRRYAFISEYALHHVDGRCCRWWLPEECYFRPVTVSVDHHEYVFPIGVWPLEIHFDELPCKVPLVIPML
jgi:hypothetical protein